MQLTRWLTLAVLTTSLQAYAYDLPQLQQLLDRQKYRLLQQELTKTAETSQQPELLVMQAKAMMSLDQDEALAEVLEKTLPQFPQHAELIRLAGINQFNLAQSSSIFSAPGYAKQGLAYFEQAASLAPDEAKYQRGLIDFYAAAPSIVGGDKKKAQQLADALQQKNPIHGTLAQVALLRRQDKAPDALKLTETLKQQHPASPEVLEAYARQLADQNRPAEAFAVYQQVLPLYAREVEQYPALLQLGQLAAIAGQDKAAGKQALEKYLSFFADSDNPNYPWAQLRLAQIHLLEQNKAAAEQMVASLLAQEPEQEKLQKELKALQKSLKQLKS